MQYIQLSTGCLLDYFPVWPILKTQVKRTAPAKHIRADRSVRERAYLLIQQKIARGELPPGSAVSEIPLAQELGSSRTPIREALGQLVAEGLLEQTPNRGAVVVQLGRQDIIDLYELREALEVYAVGKVAARANSPQDLQRLQAFADQILTLRDELRESGRDKLDVKQMNRFITCDLGFHTLLLRIASNARILKVKQNQAPDQNLCHPSRRPRQRCAREDTWAAS